MNSNAFIVEFGYSARELNYITASFINILIVI